MQQYGQDVIHLAYSYVRNYHQAQDIAQDVFLRAYTKQDTFRGDSSVKTWLLSITANRARDYLRSWSAKHEVQDETVFLDRQSPLDTEEEVEQRLARDELWSAVHALPLTYREVVVLYYQRELSSQEIAAILGISEQAVRTRLHRGRILLKQWFEERGRAHDTH